MKEDEGNQSLEPQEVEEKEEREEIQKIACCARVHVLGTWALTMYGIGARQPLQKSGVGRKRYGGILLNFQMFLGSDLVVFQKIINQSK
jgi:hypothetical protein